MVDREASVSLTVEEARLPRLADGRIPYQRLTSKVGPIPVNADAASLADLGSRLWRTAVRDLQSGELWDDRALYWSRLAYTAELRGRVDPATLAVFERTSRGLADVSFPGRETSGNRARRVIVTGFDPFHLDRQIDQSNPSGLAALALDGRMLNTDSGPAMVQAAVFPVRFADFDAGMVEDFINPLLARADLIVTLSMGREGFDLERFPGRRRSSAVTDNLNVLTGARPDNPLVPGTPDGDLIGPEFLEFTLPAEAMVSVGGAFPIRDNRNVATLETGDLAAADLSSLDGQTAVRGSGGGYLSNEIAYRTLLANTQKFGPAARIPMGHLHTPRLAGFDPELERSVVTQIEAMLVAALEAL